MATLSQMLKITKRRASWSAYDKTYQKGISLSKEEMKKYQSQIHRSVSLPKWDVKILPKTG